jgi:Uma2 family endonuclease
MAVRLKMTAAEYLELPETTKPMMLLDGEVIEMPGPTPDHQYIIQRIYDILKSRTAAGRILFAPVDVLLDSGNVVQPDLLWIAPDSQTCSIGPKSVIGAPDFVAEVLSPGTARYDRGYKFDLYQRHGTREYWLADPEAQYIEVYVRVDDRFQRLNVYGPDETIPSPLFGGVSAGELFKA